MSEAPNIEEFKEVAGKILGKLYSTHPIAQWDGPELIYGEGVEITNHQEGVYFETIEYLYENGYISKPQDAFLRLKDKGYEALQMPHPLKPEQSLGSSLATWVKSAGSSVTKDSLSEVASGALKALFATFSS